MRIYNPEVLNNLTPASPNGGEYIYAFIEEMNTTETPEITRYPFLLNPQSLAISVQANYQEVAVPGRNIPDQRFNYSSGRTLSIQGLVFKVPGYSKSIGELLDNGIKLCRASGDKFHTPIVKFVWGSREFAPAVVTAFNFTETGWDASGYPTEATGDMSLIEVASDEDTNTVTASTTDTTKATSDNNVGNGTGTTKLTERQLETGSKEAIKWLKENMGKLDTEQAELVRASRFKIRTDDNRAVFMTDRQGKDLIEIGVNERGKFKPIK